jgi:glycine cleavage system H protein
LKPPENLLFSPLHTWARVEDDRSVTVGITVYAQYELGELQYFGLPRVGQAITKDSAFGEVESTKTVSDLYAPCSGEVVAVNSEVAANPSIVNHDPYGAGWIVRVMPTESRELETLLGPSAYDALVAGQSH